MSKKILPRYKKMGVELTRSGIQELAKVRINELEELVGYLHNDVELGLRRPYGDHQHRPVINHIKAGEHITELRQLIDDL